jgi:TetR/AcrR family transcriptional repressor of mexJK operon
MSSGTDVKDKAVREGLAHKRAAILGAARELFVQNGVERTSMDAVAARAGVSKRTVYDYYGNKQRLLLGVIEGAGESALATAQHIIESRLANIDALGNPGELESVLEDFAVELGSSLFASSEYVAAVRLIRENEATLPELGEHPLRVAHTKLLADQFARLGGRGLLNIKDPDLAAEHFYALTTLRVMNETSARRANPDHVRQILTDGADVFFRAYAQRPDER